MPQNENEGFYFGSPVDPIPYDEEFIPVSGTYDVNPYAPADSQIPTVNLEFTPANDYELVNIESYALSPITSSTGLKGILLDIIGPYDNIVTQYQYHSNTSSNWSYVNEITPDYPWIASAALFIVLLITVFRALRGGRWLK